MAEAIEQPTIRETESDLIAATLAWISRRFGANAARFVRPVDSGGWLVVTWMNDGISLHPADQAESAMAWMVALGRERLLVSKPRVSAPEGSSVRPISARNYLGIPAICHDRILGVIEVAGDLRPDIEAAATAAQDEIDQFAARLSFDPSLRPAPALTPETRVALGGGSWPHNETPISAEEFRFVAALLESQSIGDVAAAAGICTEHALEITLHLERRGMIEIVN